ncbi:MAG: hydantoinase/oxoprolinase family protein [Bacillota bacterium]
MKIRIGIDVGGTFTDGVAIDNEEYEILGKVKVPTSHNSDNGVAQGIIDVLHKLMEKSNFKSEDIMFLAHGTTQATNALLEGDVDKVGVLGTGQGLEGLKAKKDTKIDEIELSPDKYIKTLHDFIETDKLDQRLNDVLSNLKAKGANVIVAAEPYSVDNSENENKIMKKAIENDLPATATHQISNLYGLKVRTKTSVINASILPKMVETANMTSKSVEEVGIGAPLMIMRGDGGVMSVSEVKKRPILTLLSGPAGGVAGALMYENISDGIFLESGGTSTDISVVKNGEVMISFSEIGGHKTHVNSLDVRTVGIAGGSMIRGPKKLEDVGPRSAHIAGLPYEVYTGEEELDDLKLVTIKPTQEDPGDYIAVENSEGKKFALTLAGAANVLESVPQESYAYGNYNSAYKAFKPLAEKWNLSVEDTAKKIMKKASLKIKKVVDQLINEYKLEESIIELVGGGGSAGVITPFLGEFADYKFRIANNAEVISTIGVALAMVKEVVERTVIQTPTEEDILKIRKEAEEAVLKSGAKEGSIQIKVEFDKKNSILRAIASGSTDLKEDSIGKTELSEPELKEIAAESLESEINNVELTASSKGLLVYQTENIEKKFFSLFKKKTTPLRVINKQGVIKLKLTDGDVLETEYKNLKSVLEYELNERTRYRDGGAETPYVYIACRSNLVNLSGLMDKENIISMADVELKGFEDDDKVFMIFDERGK